MIRYYRELQRKDFENAGSLDNPSIMLDSVGEGIRFCGGRPADYMHIYINVRDDRIEDIRYLCNCDPTANVAVEVLCNLVRGRTLEEVEATTEDSIFLAVGSRSEQLQKKAKGLLELMGRGLVRYRAQTGASAGPVYAVFDAERDGPRSTGPT